MSINAVGNFYGNQYAEVQSKTARLSELLEQKEKIECDYWTYINMGNSHEETQGKLKERIYELDKEFGIAWEEYNNAIEAIYSSDDISFDDIDAMAKDGWNTVSEEGQNSFATQMELIYNITPVVEAENLDVLYENSKSFKYGNYTFLKSFDNSGEYCLLDENYDEIKIESIDQLNNILQLEAIFLYQQNPNKTADYTDSNGIQYFMGLNVSTKGYLNNFEGLKLSKEVKDGKISYYINGDKENPVESYDDLLKKAKNKKAKSGTTNSVGSNEYNSVKDFMNAFMGEKNVNSLSKEDKQTAFRKFYLLFERFDKDNSGKLETGELAEFYEGLDSSDGNFDGTYKFGSMDKYIYESVTLQYAYHTKDDNAYNEYKQALQAAYADAFPDNEEEKKEA